MNRRNQLLLGVLSGAAVAVVAEAVRPRGGAGRAVDWDHVGELALRWGGADGALGEAELATAAEGYNRLAAEIREPLLRAVGDLPDGVELPPFQALDRAGWIRLNLDILRRVLDPVLDSTPLPNTLALEVGRAGLDRYIALLLAFLARRVLGQFDPNLLGREPIEETALCLVETNVAGWEARADLPGDQLRGWLILHETTHAWQFLGHPWLREHLNGMLESALRSAGGSGADPLRRLGALVVGVPGQLALLRRMQATMTLIEGYSNLVMNLVGRDLLPAFDALEAAYQERAARRRSVLEQLFWRVTGLDMKLRQYEAGERFCAEVHRARGMEALNLAWRGPEFLPRSDELARPEEWYARVKRLG